MPAPAIAAGSFLLAQLGNLFLGEHGLAVWWPLNGLVSAVLMLVHPRQRLTVLASAAAGNMAAYLLNDFGALGIWYGLGDAAEAAIGAWGLRRLAGNGFSLRDTRHILWLALTAALAAIPSALICAVFASQVAHHGFFSFMGTWWLGSALGMILTAPAVLASASLFRARQARPAMLEPVLLAAPTAIVASIAVSQAPMTSLGLTVDVRYLVFPLLIWAALRLSPEVTSMVVLIAALAAAVSATPLIYPARADAIAQLVQIQAFLCVTGLTALLLAATARSMRDALARAKSSEDALRRLSIDLDRAREDERARISAEIHDELGQELTVLKLEIARGMNHEARAAHAGLRQIDRTIASVRKLAKDLRPPSLDHLGLPAAVESHIEDFSHRTGIRTRVSIGQAGGTLAGEPALAIYRVVQEALTNVARHSGARSVSIDMTEEDGALTVEISDDGRGCDLEKTRNGIGLIGMRERLARAGGFFEFGRGRLGGSLVRCRLPIPDAAAMPGVNA